MLFSRKLFYVPASADALFCGSSLEAQVQTIVPPWVPGAKPVTIKRIKVHSCLSPLIGGEFGPSDDTKQRAIHSERRAPTSKSPAELAAVSRGFASAQYATAAAWAPDPKNPPLVSSFTIYSGTHQRAVADRFKNFVMPFFSRNLCFTAPCQ